MRALKLIQHMKTNAERMTDEVLRKIRDSKRCSELLLAVSAEEQKQSTLNVYRDLTAWLGTESDATIEQRYTSLGALRSRQGSSVQQPVLGHLHSSRTLMGIYATGMSPRGASRILGWCNSVALSDSIFQSCVVFRATGL